MHYHMPPSKTHKYILYPTRYSTAVSGQLHARSALPAEENPSRFPPNWRLVVPCTLFWTQVAKGKAVLRSSSLLPTASRLHREPPVSVHRSAFCWLQETCDFIVLSRGDLNLRHALLKSDADVPYMACNIDVLFRNLISSHVEDVSKFSPTFQLLSSG